MPLHDKRFAQTIAVKINGKVHKHWTRYSIDNDFLIPADAFDFDIGIANQALGDELFELAGDAVQVLVDDELVLTGIIDDCSHSLSKGSRGFSVNGRDGASILLDCSTPQTNVQGLNAIDAVKKIANPLGIDNIVLKAEKTPPKLDKIDIEPGQSAWDAIIAIANSVGLHAWFSAEGQLVIGGADYSSEPVATLYLNQETAKKNNIKSLDLQTSVRDSFSEITFLAQSHGRSGQSASHDLKWVYKDDTVPFHKPKTIVLGDVNDLASLKKNAKKQISDYRLNGFDLTVTVAGHKTEDGTLWQAGQRVHIIAAQFGIDAIFYVMGRKFSLSKFDGQTTQLRLKEDGIWTPDAYPKPAQNAQKRKGKRKGKKSRKQRKKVLAVV